MKLKEFNLKDLTQSLEVIRSSESGGIMVAVKDKLKNIVIQLGETKEVGQTLWIRLDNGKEKIRIGTVYAPQESRTRLTEHKKLYKAIETHIIEKTILYSL